MSSLTATPLPVLPPPVAAAAAPAAFGTRILVGLLGVLLAVLCAGLNEMVTKASLADIRGGMFIGADEGAWLIAVYSAASVSAMAFSPWLAATFSLRRFTLCAIGVFALLGLVQPYAPNLSSLMLLRTLQGLASGALPPMLMSVALRFLPPGIKVYGLAGYALTATFGPNLGTPLAGLWTEYVGWQWAFWQIILPSLLAMACVAWGLPQDPLRLERFRQFDWRGLLLGLPAICTLVIGLTLGDRMGWFDSSLICWLLGGGLVLLVLFLCNEWSEPLPFFKLQMLKVRNLTHALVTLFGVLIVLTAVIIIPSSYLAQIQGYRPAQTGPLMLLVALPQLLALPLVAALCNIRAVDCRWVLAAGLGMLSLSCALGSQLTSVWIRDNFYLLQLLHIFGQPMSVIPLLMLATGGMTPQDGPFASAWFNTVKGLASVVAAGLIEALTTVRRHFHSNALVDSLGNSPLADSSAPGLARRIHEQALVLTSADLYLCMALLAAALIVLIPFVPTRIYPPRAVA
ncbi:MFS transporter [Pseudomonas vranovensis]|uniref:EmrB/QacA family drug resistance transporter n=1 Tax=Pseudomonas vranovensis TaxID=321661 RepID=A0A423DJC0_9PSED|nr:MFS transporter [Pseudomonas vranovensis]ROL71667.1 EmrB/QacA family drug resistance transporter [Pseudomonas vranovensis]